MRHVPASCYGFGEGVRAQGDVFVDYGFVWNCNYGECLLVMLGEKMGEKVRAHEEV